MNTQRTRVWKHASILLLASISPLLFGVISGSAQTLGSALNNTNLTWFSTNDPANGYTAWVPETSVSHDHQAAVQAQCPVGESDFYSDLTTSIVGPCTVSFWWKVNTAYTQPEFRVDNQFQQLAEVNTNEPDDLAWHRLSLFLAAGAHVLDWSYYGINGESVWLDQVTASTVFDPSQMTNFFNIADVPEGSYHAIKAAPDGGFALICIINYCNDGSWLVYCHKDTNGQWLTERITSGSSYGAQLFFPLDGEPIIEIPGAWGGVYKRNRGVWNMVSGGIADDGLIFDDSSIDQFPLQMTPAYTSDMTPDGKIQELSAYTQQWPWQVMTNLLYSVYAPGGWSTGTAPFVGASCRRTAESDDPRFMDMVLDENGKVHAVYVPFFQEDGYSGGSAVYSELWYLTNKRGVWESQRIIAPATNTWGDAGLGASIAIAPNGQPAVASILIGRAATGSANSARLLYNELQTNGTWGTTTIASSPDGYSAGDGAIGTGFAPLLEFDPHGRPHIAFTDFATQHFGDAGQDEFGGNLRHAWRDGAQWKFTTVFRQTDPIHNQFEIPNMMVLSNKVIVIGRITHDNLDSDLTVESTDYSLAYVEFVPTDYIDITPPTISIAYPAMNQQFATNSCLMSGTAADNQGVSSVWTKLNDNDWILDGGTTNWTAGVTLVPGTNTIMAYAMDLTGSHSATNSVKVIYVVSAALQVQTAGLGTLSPNYSNAVLTIGKGYSMTATPGNGFAFTNWTISTNWIGGSVTNSATVQFMMASNLTIQANFADVTKPTLSVSAPTAGEKMTNALVKLVGTAADNWKVAGVWYQLNGGVWNLAVTTNAYTNWTAMATLLAGSNMLKTYALDLAGNFSTTNTLSVVSSNSFLLHLSFSNAVPLKTNGFGFNLQLSPGLNGHIQVSTNLTTWTTLTNFIGTNSVLSFRDPAATNGCQRYYRAVVP